MAKVRFGLKNVSKEAPKSYRRIVNAFIVFVMPSVATAIVSIPETIISNDWKIFLGLGATVATAAFKGLEYFLSEEDEK